MKDFLLKTLLNLKGEKLIRHGLTSLIGVAAAHGVVLNIDNTASFLSGGLLLLGVIGWSVWRKAEPTAEVRDLLKVIATSAGTQLATLSAGYLAAKGIASPDQAQTPAAALLALIVYALSQKAAPDVKKIAPLLVLAFMTFSQTACVAARGEGWVYTSLGTDNTGLAVTASGMSAASMVQSTGVEKAGAAIVRNTMIGGLMRIGNTAVDTAGDAALKAIE
jgi:predicted small integral membrane protein